MDWTELDQRIDGLVELTNNALSGERSWREFWSEVRQIGECFKDRELKYPTREERNQAWGRFQAVVSDAKGTRQEQSEELRDEVIGRLDSIQFPMGGIFSAAADLVAGTFSAVVAPGIGHVESSEKSLLRMAAAELKEARSRYHETKRLLTPEDNEAVWKQIQEVQAELQNSWEACENTEAQVRLSRLRDARARKIERLERLEDRRSRIEENVASNEARLESARGDEYRERVEGWLAEGREQLEQIDEDIEAVSVAIREIEEKIDHLE